MSGDARRRALRARAFAKINLSLQVLGLRPDGYHELRTTFQSLRLHDTLTFTPRPGPFAISCDDPGCPVDERNLVWRAAEQVWRMAGKSGLPSGVRVHITKRIPMQAGLGGGSSDAAAAIRALARLWRRPLSPPRLQRLATALGADVAFFLHGGTARGAGRGDRLVSVNDSPPAWVVLVMPSFGVSTAEAYGWWDAAFSRTSRAGLKPRRPAEPRRSAAGDRPRNDPPQNDLSQNDLQAPVEARHPEIATIVAALRRAGARHAAMSGSGSAVFGLFDRRTDADEAARTVARRSRRTIVTRTLGRAAYAASARPAPTPPTNRV